MLTSKVFSGLRKSLKSRGENVDFCELQIDSCFGSRLLENNRIKSYTGVTLGFMVIFNDGQS